MDITCAYDPTLPLDLDGSANPDLLTEVTFGSHLEYPDGSVPMVAKISSGRMSPVRARTMKEYDQQIGELKKENFNLKLRIYFLEERLQQKLGDGEDVFRTNIELKVDVESLKKELADKQELLKKASNAIESVVASHQTELAEAKDRMKLDLEATKKQLQESQKIATAKQQELDQLVKKLESVSSEVKNNILKDKKIEVFVVLVDDLNNNIKERDELVKKLQEEKQRALDELTDINKGNLEKLQREISRKDRDIQHLSQVVKDTSVLDGSSILTNNHLQDVVDDQEESIKKLEDLNKKLNNKNKDHIDMIAKLEDKVRMLDKDKKEMKNEMMQLEETIAKQKENALKRDNAIIGLTKAMKEKAKEVQELAFQIEQGEAELSGVKRELNRISVERSQDAHKHHDELSHLDTKLSNKEAELSQRQKEIENLVRSLGKKEGELENVRDLLDKAEMALRQSEEAVQSIQEQLQQENTERDRKMKLEIEDFKRLLDESEKDVKMKEQQLQQLRDLLQSKDQQLGHFMQLLDTNRKNQKEKNNGDDNAGAEVQQLKAEVDRLKVEVDRLKAEANQLQAELDKKNEALKRLHKDLGVSEKEHQQKLDRLMISIENKDSTAEVRQLLQAQLTELRHLNCSLSPEKSPRQATNQENTHHSPQSLEVEWAAIQALRSQLEDGIQHNHLTRSFLEKIDLIGNLQKEVESLRSQFEGRAKPNPGPPPSAHSLTIDLNTNIRSQSNGVTTDLTANRPVPVDPRSHVNGVLDYGSHINGMPAQVPREQTHIHGLSEQVPWYPVSHVHGRFGNTSPQQTSHRPSSPYSMSPRRRSPQSISPKQKSAYSNIVNPLSPQSSSPSQLSPVHMSMRGRSTGDISQALPFHMSAGDMSLSLQLSNTTSPNDVSETSSNSSSQNAMSPRQQRTTNYTSSSAMSRKQQQSFLNGFSPSAVSPKQRPSVLPNEAPSALTSLSSPDIKKLAVQLQEEVHKLSTENDKFKKQLHSVEIFREVPGANENDFTDRDDIEKLLKEIRFLRTELLSRDTELDQLKHLSVQKLSSSDMDSAKGQNVAHLKKKIQKLKTKLHEAESVRRLLEEQISVDTRTEDNPTGFNPVLIVQMASEIDRLKQKIAQASPKRHSSKQSQSQAMSVQDSQVQTHHTKDRDVQTYLSGLTLTQDQNIQTHQSQIHPTQDRNVQTHHSELQCTQDQNVQTHNGLRHTQDWDVQTYSQMINTKDCGVQTHHGKMHYNNDTQIHRGEIKTGDLWLPAEGVHNHSSRIPRLKKTFSKESCSSHGDTNPDDQDTLKHLLRNTRLQLDELKARLLSTEGTVRYQSQKIRYYRGLLADNGLLADGLVRAHSESDLAVSATSPHKQKQIKDLKKQLERYHQLLGLHRVQKQSVGTFMSSPPRSFGDQSFVKADVLEIKNKNSQLQSDLHELKMRNAELQTELVGVKSAKDEEVNNLSQLLEDCQRMNTVLQTRLASVMSDKALSVPGMEQAMDAGSDKSDTPFQRKNFSDTWNTCSQISRWLEELGDFLGDLVHSDQDGSTEVARFSGFQQRLEHSRAIVQNLSASLQGLKLEVSIRLRVGRVTLAQQKYRAERRENTRLGEQLLSTQHRLDDELQSQGPVGAEEGLSGKGPVRMRETENSLHHGAEHTSVRRWTLDNTNTPSVFSSHSGHSKDPCSVAAGVGTSRNSATDINRQLSYIERMRHRTASGATDYSRSTGMEEPRDKLTSSEDSRSDYGVLFYSGDGHHIRPADQLLETTATTIEDQKHEDTGMEMDMTNWSMLDHTDGPSLAGLSNRSRSHSPEVEQLKAKLDAVADLNKTLKDEVNLYESLYNKSHHSSDSDLQQHLAEIRALRLRLEKSLEQSDKLHEKLENFQPRSESSQGSEMTMDELYKQLLDKKRTVEEMQVIVIEKEKLIFRMSQEIQERERHSTMVTDSDKIINDLTKKLAHQENIISEQEQIISEMNVKIRDIEDVMAKHHDIVNEYGARISRYEAECSKYESDLSKYQHENERYEATVRELMERISKHQIQTEELKIDLESKKRIVDHQNQLVQELEQNKLKKQMKLLEEKERDCLDWQAKLDQMMKEKEDSLCRQQKLESLLKEKEADCVQWRLKVERVVEERERSSQTQQKLEQMLREKREDCARYGEKLEKLMKEREESGSYDTQSQEVLLSHQRSEHVDFTDFTRQHKQVLVDKDRLKHVNQKLTTDKEQLEVGLKKASKEIRKLQSERKHLKEQVQENSFLNQSLKVELSIYEKLQQQPTTDGKAVSIEQELFEEIRRLRVQLERCIVTNTSLRQKVEQLLEQKFSVEKVKSQAASETSEDYVLTGASSSSASPTGSADFHWTNGTTGGNISYRTDGNISYRTDDAPEVIKELLSQKVDSDVRNLFAIGKLEDHEKLQKENGECMVVVSGIEARLRDRLKSYQGIPILESLEYSTLKEVLLSLENLKICLGEETALIKKFWFSQIPSNLISRDPVHLKLISNNKWLHKELGRMKTKYDHLASIVNESKERLHATNQQKQEMETKIYHQLKKTADVWSQAKVNFEQHTLKERPLLTVNRRPGKEYSLDSDEDSLM
ncbi:hypothetical protein ScPMuIL_014930 [Solemya velum]